MDTLSDIIERYLRQLLAEQESLEIQRRQLAQHFRCAPSQINYVLETRFTRDRGYIVESRRGGGGYIRISYLAVDDFPACLGESVDPSEVPGLLAQLVRTGNITNREALLLQEALGEMMAAPGRDPGAAWARLLKTMLTLLYKREK